jgi:hypothetical protein
MAAITKFDQDKSNNKYDEVIQGGDHEDPHSTFLKQLSSKADELVTKSNSYEEAVSANTAKTGISSGQASAITDNTAKTGISSGQASAITANTAKTGISSGQASAITANTAKTGISSAQATAITANTAKVSLAGGRATTLSFGELITTSNGKGNPDTYSIVMSATKSGVTKTVTLTLT